MQYLSQPTDFLPNTAYVHAISRRLWSVSAKQNAREVDLLLN